MASRFRGKDVDFSRRNEMTVERYIRIMAGFL